MGGLHVSGLRWQSGDGPASFAPDALASKVLCDRHNSALSPLDAIAVRLFRSFDELHAAGSEIRVLYLFSGHDVERWLLKILCGLVVGKHLSLLASTHVDVPTEWLAILFGNAEFAPGQGLYMPRGVGEVLAGPTGLVLAPMLVRGNLVGLKALVCGYELLLSLEAFPGRVLDGRQLVYRPLELHTVGPAYEKSVLFSWAGPADLGTISVSIAEA